MRVTRLGLQIPSYTYPGVPDAELFERIAAIATTAEASAGHDRPGANAGGGRGEGRPAGRARCQRAMLRGWATVAGAEEATETMQALLDAGLDGLMFNLPDADDLDAVAMAGEVLSKAMGPG